MVSIYDIIIVGATPEGLELAKEFMTSGKKVILISSKFYKNVDLAAVTKLEAEVVFISYTHGLFGANVLQGNLKGTIFGTNIIFATGTKPIKSSLKNLNICYKAIDIVGKHKSEPAVVYGNSEEAAFYALDLAKRFCYVYLCTKEFDLKCSKKLQKKINETANIVHLPGCCVLSCKNNKEGKLIEVTLDTYATIKTTVMVHAQGRLPDVPAFLKRYIELDADGFAKVKEFNESTLVPGVYAIGKLCRNFTKRDLKKLSERLQAL